MMCVGCAYDCAFGSGARVDRDRFRANVAFGFAGEIDGDGHAADVRRDPMHAHDARVIDAGKNCEAAFAFDLVLGLIGCGDFCGRDTVRQCDAKWLAGARGSGAAL